MQTISHPSDFIPSPLADTIRHAAPEAEKLVHLHPHQLAVIYQQKWFNLYVPEAYGGLSLSLPQGLRIEEGLAWTDGSTAWTVTLCSGANWFIGFLDSGLAKEIFKGDKVCFAGSGQSSGLAKHTAGGYEITGYWNYASGASHATVFTANCRLEKDGVLLQRADGSPLTGTFLFLKEEVLLHKNWHTIGMIATGSHGFEVKQLKVSHNRRFTIDPQHAVLHDPLYQYPFLQLAEATLAVNSAGMAARFLYLCENLWTANDKYSQRKTATGDTVFRLLEDALAQLEEARRAFYGSVESSWNELISRNFIEADTLAEVSSKSRQLASIARKLVDEVYPYAGLRAADPGTEINRVWRNLHTASQHALMAFSL